MHAYNRGVVTTRGIPTLGGPQLWADRRWRAEWRIQENVLNGEFRLLDPNDRRHVRGSFEACVDALDAQKLPAIDHEAVVVLHGLGRSRKSMMGMGTRLRDEGFTPIRVDYPSTRRKLEHHVDQVVDLVEHLGVERVSFVTHSLGGIIARGVLAHSKRTVDVHRVVMCAPPSQGASLARVLKTRLPSVFGAVMGPTGSQLAAGVPYPPPSVPFMVIAGSRAPKGLNPWIEGDDDGIVAVEETKLPGMQEHVVVESIHTFVMDHPEARDAAARFLAS